MKDNVKNTLWLIISVFNMELSEVLQYKKWGNFAKVINRAKLACKNSGFEVDDHFPEVKKMVEVGALQKKVIHYKK